MQQACTFIRTDAVLPVLKHARADTTPGRLKGMFDRPAPARLREPTDGQKATGNYRKLHVRIRGMAIAIEHPVHTERSGKAGNGTKWVSKLTAHYGYIKGSLGADGDHVDCFIGPKVDEPDTFYVVDQKGSNGHFDESKVMIGYDTLEKAKQGYLSNYQKGWSGLMAITPVSVKDFKKWLKSDATRAPFKDWAADKSRPETEGPVTSTTRIEDDPEAEKAAALDLVAAVRAPGGATIKIALANTPAKRERGLAGVANLPEDQGMLFDIPGPFWMRGTKIALDIAFLTRAGEVLDVQTMPLPGATLPHFLPKYASAQPGAVYALELGAGVAAKQGIKPGVRLEIGNIAS